MRSSFARASGGRHPRVDGAAARQVAARAVGEDEVERPLTDAGRPGRLAVESIFARRHEDRERILQRARIEAEHRHVRAGYERRAARLGARHERTVWARVALELRRLTRERSEKAA